MNQNKLYVATSHIPPLKMSCRRPSPPTALSGRSRSSPIAKRAGPAASPFVTFDSDEGAEAAHPVERPGSGRTTPGRERRPPPLTPAPESAALTSAGNRHPHPPSPKRRRLDGSRRADATPVARAGTRASKPTARCDGLFPQTPFEYAPPLRAVCKYRRTHVRRESVHPPEGSRRLVQPCCALPFADGERLR